MDIFNYYRHFVVTLLIFNKLIVSSLCHRIGTHQRQQITCYRRCPGYLACLVRGIEQRCDRLGNQENHVLAGNLIRLTSRNNHRFVHPSELFSDRRYSDNNHVFLPHKSGLSDARSNTTSNNDQQQETMDRQRAEQRLYNSRIGQAISHTLRNKIGRNRGEPHQNNRNFTSIGWRDSAVRNPGREQTITNLHQITLNIAQTTQSSLNINVPQENGSSCTACDGNSDCSNGDYCYYSATCARRTCQPI